MTAALLAAFYAVMAGSLTYAWFAGGGAERIGVLLLIGFFVFRLALRPLVPAQFDEIDPLGFAQDLIGFVGFVWIGLRARRYWPLAAAALQMLSVSAHFARSLDLPVDPWAYCPAAAQSDPARLCSPGNWHGELPSPSSPMEALGLVPGLVWPGDGALLAQAFTSLAQARSETLIVTLHDPCGRYICAFQYQGDVSGIRLDYRILIESALANRASGLLLIHNHPSGDPTPSASDIEATRMLAALCRPLKLVLHDHLIVGTRTLTSMRRAGLFNTARKAAA